MKFFYLIFISLLFSINLNAQVPQKMSYQALNNTGAFNNGIITKNDKGMYGVRYNDFISIMVKVIQEQHQQIENLKNEIETLKKK